MLLVALNELSLLASLGEGVRRIARFLGDDPSAALAALTEGRHDLCDGLWVNVETPQGRDDGPFETHRLHADLQINLEGDERVALAPLEALTVQTPYDARRDIAFWSGGPQVTLPLAHGTGLWLFPRDGHLPCLGRGRLKKAVFKVHRSLFEPSVQNLLFR